MNAHLEKLQARKSHAVANALSQYKYRTEPMFQFIDNRSESAAQMKLQEMADDSPQIKRAVQLQAMVDNYSPQKQNYSQQKASPDTSIVENRTGLPDKLKSGIENLSGYLMDDVTVYRNSVKPAQLHAFAYAEGSDIHLGPGQEKHLPHEAWHVVQQKQGRVKPNSTIKGKLNVNQEVALENEADRMGARATMHQNFSSPNDLSTGFSKNDSGSVIQGKFAEDTTFGLEVEFANRWVSPVNYGKDLEEAEIDNPKTINGWKAGTDRGRMPSGYAGTVLELESKVYSGPEFHDDSVNKAIDTAFERSIELVNLVRLKNNLENKDSLENKNLQSGNLLEEPTKLNIDQIEKDHKEEPKATVQVTTLGRRTDDHLKMLESATSALDDKNLEIFSKTDFKEKAIILLKAKQEAKAMTSRFKSAATLDSDPSKVIMEDLAAVVSALVRSLVLIENGMVGAGTIKNLVDPLPRRRIGPPEPGFREALKISKSTYESLLVELAARLRKLGKKELGEIEDVARLFSWIAYKANDTDEINDSTAIATTGAELDKSDNEPRKLNRSGESNIELRLKYLLAMIPKKTDGLSLWHNIAQSKPTLEHTIIDAAGKKNPAEWTAHEIRNVAFSTKIDKRTMQDFMSLLTNFVYK
jgi:hypothetical protein